MSQHPEDQSRQGAEDTDFESGLDYGSYASEDPDYPEDHLSDTPADAPGAGTSPDSAAAGEQQHATRSLSEELAAQRAQTSEQPTTVIPPTSSPSSSASPSSASPSSTATQDWHRVPDEDRPTETQRDGETYPATEPDRPGADDQATTVVPPVAPVPQRSAGAADDAAAAGAVGTGTAAGAGTAVGTAPAQPVTHARSDSPAHPGAPGEPAHARGETAVAARPVRTAPANEEITDADIDAEVAKTRRGASRFLTVLLAIFTPVLFLVAALRIVGSPVFLWATYQRPGFPDDPHGFGLDERMLYGSYGMDFLFNLANSRYLADLTGPDGELLFTSQGQDLNEVGHMMDVKQLVWIAMLVGLVLLVLILLFALLLRSWRPGAFARGVFAGAWVSIGLLIGLVVLAFLDWQEFFAQFHGLLFSGNWQFPDDYALIRLYPNQFWIDAGIWMAALLLIFSVVALLMTWPTARRRARRADRLAEVHERRREKLIDELNSASA